MLLVGKDLFLLTSNQIFTEVAKIVRGPVFWEVHTDVSEKQLRRKGSIYQDSVCELDWQIKAYIP